MLSGYEMVVSVMPTVRAELARRFIFNFRMPPAELSALLPVPWLAPDVVDGYGVASFCVLDLRNIAVAPLPPLVATHGINAARRYAVMDRRDGDAKAVYVTERLTNSGFGAWLTSLGFPAAHEHIAAALVANGDTTTIEVDEDDARSLFRATVRPAETLRSEIFASSADFAAFIARGVRSYGNSRHGARLTVVDLDKDDGTYVPLIVDRCGGSVADAWTARGAVLDSALLTTGGTYRWSYRGLTAPNR